MAKDPDSLSLGTAYKASGGYETSSGTIYVSKPYRSKASKKLRALITFAPRNSAFDINNNLSSSNEFRGFFSLFWISIFIFTVQTYVRSIETSGRPLNLDFATMFSQDAITLALSDAALVLSTGICVPIAKAMKNGWFRYRWTAVVLQHLLQTSILFGAISWTFNRNWPWVQSGFLTLHSLVMIMKMHSYITVNGQLSYVSQQSKKLLSMLRGATESAGGWDHAMAVAAAKQAEIEAQQQSYGSQISTPPNVDNNMNDSDVSIGTPKVPAGMSTSYVDVNTAHDLRKRLTAVAAANARKKEPKKGEKPNGNNIDGTIHGDGTNLHTIASERSKSIGDSSVEEELIPEGLLPHQLTYHPDSLIADMARDYSELQSELISPGPKYVQMAAKH